MIAASNKLACLDKPNFTANGAKEAVKNGYTNRTITRQKDVYHTLYSAQSFSAVKQ